MKYYEMENCEYEVLEKSYKVITGTSGSGWCKADYKEFFTFLPKSQCKIIDNKLYVPAWLVANKSIWSSVNKNRFYEIDKEGKVINKSFKDKIETDCIFKSGQEIRIDNKEYDIWAIKNVNEFMKVKFEVTKLENETLVKIL